MWRTILLGKLTISILASLAVGGVCVSRPWYVELTLTETLQWMGIGIFFLLLAIGQVAVIVLLTRKKLPD